SSPVGLSIRRTVADFVENRARSSVAFSAEAVSTNSTRRCSTPFTDAGSVSVELTFQPARETPSESRQTATVSANLAAMLLHHRDEMRILPHWIPDRVDSYGRDGQLRGPRQQAVEELDRLVVFADEHVNLGQPLRANGPIKRIHAFR